MLTIHELIDNGRCRAIVALVSKPILRGPELASKHSMYWQHGGEADCKTAS